MKKVFGLIAFSFAALLTALLPVTLAAAEKADSAATPVESRVILNYLCSSDTVILTAILSIKKDDATLALENAPVEFFAAGGAEPVSVGKAFTSQEGIAICKFNASGLPADKDGMTAYTARFAEHGKYPGAEGSFSARPAKIHLFFSIEDSVRMLKVTATQKDDKGADIAIPKETVLIYIPRLFSLLKIGEIALDESGTGTMEFPKEIVGDTLGNLVVMAKIEEHDRYGFIQGRNVINWGVHKQYYKAEVPSRELWTPIAPMWMIITLVIMLLGVWAHYFYAVYELYMIKRLSKKDKPPYF